MADGMTRRTPPGSEAEELAEAQCLRRQQAEDEVKEDAVRLVGGYLPGFLWEFWLSAVLNTLFATFVAGPILWRSFRLSWRYGCFLGAGAHCIILGFTLMAVLRSSVGVNAVLSQVPVWLGLATGGTLAYKGMTGWHYVRQKNRADDTDVFIFMGVVAVCMLAALGLFIWAAVEGFVHQM